MNAPWAGRSARVSGGLLIVLFILSNQGLSQVSNSTSWPFQPSEGSSSWAMGVAVPEGSALNGSGEVVWSLVSNLSALFDVPPLNSTDGTIFLVLSAAVGNAVIQVAAGLSPAAPAWKTYAQFIPNTGSIPLSYVWLLNGSGPTMYPGDTVRLSFLKGADNWEGYISDLTTGRSAPVGFPEASDIPLATGDQEVFALESYTSNSTVFEKMGEVVVHSITVNEVPVTGGFYFLNGWDTVRNPLFVVGTAIAPDFIATRSLSNGTISIGFSGVWQPPGFSQLDLIPFVVPLLLFALAALGLYIVHAESGRRARPIVAEK